MKIINSSQCARNAENASGDIHRFTEDFGDNMCDLVNVSDCLGCARRSVTGNLMVSPKTAFGCTV